jgi:hypothetical protein
MGVAAVIPQVVVEVLEKQEIQTDRHKAVMEPHL